MNTTSQKIINNKISSFLLVLLFLTLPFEKVLTFEMVGFTVKPPYIAGIFLICYFLYSLVTRRIKISFKNYDYAAALFIILSYATFFWSIDRIKTLVISSMFLFVYLIFLSVRSFIGCHSGLACPERGRRDPESRNNNTILDPRVQACLPAGRPEDDKGEAADDKRLYQDNKSGINFYLNIFVWLGVVCSFFALFQFFGDSYGLSQQLTGLSNLYTKSVFGFPRVQSTFFEPGFFASFLLIALFMNLLRLNSRNFYYYLSFIVLCVAFILTLSRGGFYSFLIAYVVAVVLIFVKRKDKMILIYRSMELIVASITLALFSVWLVAGPQGLYTFFGQSRNTQDLIAGSSQESVQNFTRNATIKIALQNWQKNIFGIGTGTFGSLPELQETRALGNERQTVNSLYPEILVEGGIQSLLAFLAFLTLLLWSLLAPILSSQTPSALRIEPKDPQKDFSAPDKSPRGVEMTQDGVVGSIIFSAAMLAIFIQYLSFSTLYLVYIWVFLGLIAAHSDSRK